jgi:hypothetical protein
MTTQRRVEQDTLSLRQAGLDESAGQNPIRQTGVVFVHHVQPQKRRRERTAKGSRRAGPQMQDGADAGLRRDVRSAFGQILAARGEDAILDPRHSRGVYIRF